MSLYSYTINATRALKKHYNYIIKEGIIQIVRIVSITWIADCKDSRVFENARIVGREALSTDIVGWIQAS